MEVVSPTSLGEALRVKAEHPEAVPIQGGTDVMVELNFDRRRPEVLLNLNEVPELRGWSQEDGALRLASGLTYAEAMEPPLAELLPALAEASRTVGSPQIRNRGTLGGNLGTASPAGDALPGWDILSHLARKLGATMDFQSPKAVFTEAKQKLAFMKDADWGRTMLPVQLRFANSRG